MSSGGIANIQNSFIQSQSQLYNSILPSQAPFPQGSPYVLPPNAAVKTVPSGVNSAVNTADPYIKTYEKNSILDNLASLWQPIQIPDGAKLAQDFCVGASLDTLLQTQNTNAAVRCGWLYTPGNNGATPQVSQGFYGVQQGPFPVFNPPKGATWYWDVAAAKKQVLTDRCKTLNSCSNVSNQQYQGCGFCTTTQQGIPVDANGKPLYTDDMRLACSGGQIITQSTNCPSQAVVGPTTTVTYSDGTTRTVPNICNAMNGRLSKDCILGLVEKGGCQAGGALYTALSSSTNPTNYADLLPQYNPTQIFNQYAIPNLNTSAFSGATTDQDAILGEVANLRIYLAAPENSPLGAAARDLCVVQGSIDNYNPCPNIPDNATPPWDLNCLQSNFRSQGGQAAGNIYPSLTNINTIYGQFPNYAAIKKYWAGVKANTQSTDYYTQRQAMADFYGLIVP